MGDSSFGYFINLANIENVWYELDDEKMTFISEIDAISKLEECP